MRSTVPTTGKSVDEAAQEHYEGMLGVMTDAGMDTSNAAGIAQELFQWALDVTPIITVE